MARRGLENTGKPKTVLRTSRVFTLAADHDDRVWVLVIRGLGLGLYRCIRQNQKYLTTADGLVDNRVWDLQVDVSRSPVGLD